MTNNHSAADNSGRSPSGRATRASTEPQEGLGHSASVPNAETIAAIEAGERGEVTRLDLSEAIHWISANPNGDGNVTACGKPHVFPMRGNGWRVRDITCPDCDRAIIRTLDAAASAIEAQRAATVKQGAVHESAVPNGETPK